MKNQGYVKIVIACGSGICSSGVAKVKMQELAEEVNVPVEVVTCNHAELFSELDTADIACTTMPYEFPEEVERGLNVFPLLTGIGAASCKETLKNWMTEIYEG